MKLLSSLVIAVSILYVSLGGAQGQGLTAGCPKPTIPFATLKPDKASYDDTNKITVTCSSLSALKSTDDKDITCVGSAWKKAGGDAADLNSCVGGGVIQAVMLLTQFVFIPLVLILCCFVAVARLSHPQLGGSTGTKVMAILSLSLGLLVLLLLPFDVLNTRVGSPLPMKGIWLGAVAACALWTFVALPTSRILLKWRDDGSSVNRLLWMSVRLLAYVGIFALGVLGLVMVQGFASIKKTSDLFGLIVLAYSGWMWIWFALFCGVGLASIPANLYYSWREDTAVIDEEEKDNHRVTLRGVVKLLKDVAEKVLSELKEKRCCQSFHTRRLFNTFTQSVFLLHQEHAKLLREPGVMNRMKFLVMMLCTFLSAILTCSWVGQMIWVILQTDPAVPKSGFLESIFNWEAMTVANVFNPVGVGMYVIFAFYLFAAALEGMIVLGSMFPAFFTFLPTGATVTTANTFTALSTGAASLCVPAAHALVLALPAYLGVDTDTGVYLTGAAEIFSTKAVGSPIGGTANWCMTLLFGGKFTLALIALFAIALMSIMLLPW
eukprot:737310_1